MLLSGVGLISDCAVSFGVIPGFYPDSRFLGNQFGFGARRCFDVGAGVKS